MNSQKEQKPSCREILVLTASNAFTDLPIFNLAQYTMLLLLLAMDMEKDIDLIFLQW